MIQAASRPLLHQACLAGASALIDIRFDANEIMRGVTAVLCYGTEVRAQEE